MEEWKQEYEEKNLLDSMGRLRRNVPEHIKQTFRKQETSELGLQLVEEFTKATSQHQFFCSVCEKSFEGAYNNIVSSKRGCSICSGIQKANNRRGTWEDFVTRSGTIHNNKYTYPKQVFTKQKDKYIILCPIHGEFIQSADKHLNGQGCPDCKNLAQDTVYLWRDNDIYKVGVSTTPLVEKREAYSSYR